MKHIVHILDFFWSRHPALLYGISGLLSFYCALSGTFLCFGLLFFLYLISVRSLERIFLLCALSLSIMGYIYTSHKLPDIPKEGVEGRVYFQIDAIQCKETAFGRQKIYRGTAKRFWPANSTQGNQQGRSFPCTVGFSEKKHRQTPAADRDYIFDGTLKRGPAGNYFFIPKKDGRWIPIEGGLRLAEFRASAKASVKQFLRKHISDPQSGLFLSGIVTGEFEDRMQTFLFKQSGLLHLMAISGFHFSLLAAIFALFCRLFLSLRATACVSILALTVYLFFLGESPSILRAWTMISVLFLAVLLQKKSTALNALGVAFLVTLIFNPLSLNSVGFQLSAAITASILLFYPIVNDWLRSLIFVRPLSVIKRMSIIDQHLYCALWSLRESLSLMCAVNVVAIPLSLYYFGSFPLAGLAYNLFIPFLVGCALFGLLCAVVLFAFFPSLGEILFSLTSWFTRFTLNFIYDAPSLLRIQWRVEQLSGAAVACYLAVIYAAAIYQNTKHFSCTPAGGLVIPNVTQNLVLGYEKAPGVKRSKRP